MAAILVLGLAAIIWISLPWRVELTTRPVLFMQQDGVTVNWGTNLPAANLLRYGDTPALDEQTIPQTHGLIDVSEGMQRVYLPGEPRERLYYQAFSAGVRTINPTSALKAGEAQSETIQVNFPSLSVAEIKIYRIPVRVFHMKMSIGFPSTDYNQIILISYLGDSFTICNSIGIIVKKFF